MKDFRLYDGHREQLRQNLDAVSMALLDIEEDVVTGQDIAEYLEDVDDLHNGEVSKGDADWVLNALERLELASNEGVTARGTAYDVSEYSFEDFNSLKEEYLHR